MLHRTLADRCKEVELITSQIKDFTLEDEHCLRDNERMTSQVKATRYVYHVTCRHA